MIARTLLCLVALVPGFIRISSAAPGQTSTSLQSQAPAVAKHYAHAVHISYQQAREAAETLQAEVEKFASNPTTSTLRSAKRAWVDAHRVYSLTEVFRFYDGPIDNPTTGPEGLMNAWPLDEAYIDYVDGDATAGIINRTAEFPEITPDLLVSMNEKDGEKNISTGFHAIEFLLWGQDKSVSGAGERPLTDYAPDNPTAARRGTYLKLLANLLVKHLQSVEAEWLPGEPNYRSGFEQDSSASLQKIFTGIAMMAGDELSKERMAVPLETGDQEDEQSCFSDTTLTDLQQNLVSIKHVYTGAHPGAEGPGPGSILASVSPAAHKAVLDAYAAAEQAMAQIKAPYDVALQDEDGRAKINAAVTTIEALAVAIVKAAESLGLTINLK